MKFEYDPDKSASNFTKHGIDFDAAQAVWDDKEAIGIPARDLDEKRYLAIGCVGAKCWSVVWTMRGERVRIISARRSRKEEVALYESARIRRGI